MTTPVAFQKNFFNIFPDLPGINLQNDFINKCFADL